MLAWCALATNSCREESGCCYALDIGGTNFRVVYYKLSDKHGVVVRDTDMSTAESQLVWFPDIAPACSTAGGKPLLLVRLAGVGPSHHSHGCLLINIPLIGLHAWLVLCCAGEDSHAAGGHPS